MDFTDQLTPFMPAEKLLPFLNKGDSVEFRRFGGVYSHFGLVETKLTMDGPGMDESASIIEKTRSGGAATFIVGFAQAGLGNSGGTVRIRNLLAVAGGSLCRKNNTFDEYAAPRLPDEIIDRARGQLGETFYNVLTANCEHFVNECRYGIPASPQVERRYHFSRISIRASSDRIRVLVTGAAGEIGYSIVLEIAKGGVFGLERPVDLILFDAPPMAAILEGVAMELMDCALPTLHSVIPVTNEEDAFKGIDAAFLIGAMPRKEGMERKDLLAANVKIFKSQGQSLAKHAKKTVKVLVVGNSANTNALVCSKYAAPAISPRQISAMTRLDHNRSMAQIAARCGVPIDHVKNVIIWGNHSSTQFPDVRHAKVLKNGQTQDAYNAVNDEGWLRGEFINVVQKRDAEIIKCRKLSSAMSVTKAACDHMRDWFFGTPDNEWVSMAVSSDGSYGIPEGLIYSFPVCVDHITKDWSIVQGLPIDDFARQKMTITLQELVEEKSKAFAACDQ